ncbi:MAG: hypothetical protein Q8N22_01820 [bacterium]|nr:hypothetical protein [bacterium]
MEEEKFEAQCQTDINQLIKEFGEPRKDEITLIYNQIKERMVTGAKITEFIHILIGKETLDLLMKDKILSGSLK